MSQERRDELLAQRALWGLDQDQSTELAGIGGGDDWSLELTAAAATVCLLEEEIEPAPEHLIARLQADAEAHAPKAAKPRPLELVGEDPEAQTRTSAASSSNSFTWLWAAAATLLAAFLAWDRFAPDASIQEMRAALLASGGELRQLEWSTGPSPRSGDASGDVVWSDAEQAGYMRFSGLPSNDPSEFQYQLWIFDGERDAAKPVDGGVFDIDAATGESIVRIDPKILVHAGAAFAVTIEKPGGVVVSDREHIVATAGL
ncbi:MAG: anti-sigma factor [Planctomycetota bacterium]|jgi:hypothetical protein